MSIRDQSLVERVSRAEKDLLDIKNAQFFGKDVTTPKVIERHNSDGSPTEYDLIGTQIPNFGGYTYAVSGYVTFTAKTQTNPYAIIIAEGIVDGSGTAPDSSRISWESSVDEDSYFTDDKKITFRLDAGASNLGTSSGIFNSTDRLWLKVYVFATDYGEITFDYPIISPYDGIARGSVVPLT